MNSIAIYKILKRVPDTSESEARAAANSIAHVNDVATKTDVVELKSDIVELKSDIAELKTDTAELKSDIAELRTDTAELKTELTGFRATMEKTVTYLEEKISTQIAQSEARMTWRMTALTGVIIAAIGLFTKF